MMVKDGKQSKCRLLKSIKQENNSIALINSSTYSQSYSKNPLMIICAGESLIDMVSFATENGEVQYSPHVGGSILNSAIASREIGC